MTTPVPKRGGGGAGREAMSTSDDRDPAATSLAPFILELAGGDAARAAGAPLPRLPLSTYEHECRQLAVPHAILLHSGRVIVTRACAAGLACRAFLTEALPSYTGPHPSGPEWDPAAPTLQEALDPASEATLRLTGVFPADGPALCILCQRASVVVAISHLLARGGATAALLGRLADEWPVQAYVNRAAPREYLERVLYVPPLDAAGVGPIVMPDTTELVLAWDAAAGTIVVDQSALQWPHGMGRPKPPPVRLHVGLDIGANVGALAGQPPGVGVYTGSTEPPLRGGGSSGGGSSRAGFR
jgi:hypothetical protein